MSVWPVILAHFISTVIAGFLIAPIYRRYHVTTAHELLTIKFRNKWMGVLAGVVYLILTVAYMAVAICAPAFILERVSDLNIHLSIFVLSVICISYTALGGIKGVMWSVPVAQF